MTAPDPFKILLDQLTNRQVTVATATMGDIDLNCQQWHRHDGVVTFVGEGNKFVCEIAEQEVLAIIAKKR